MTEVIPSTRTKPEPLELREAGFNFGVLSEKTERERRYYYPFVKSDCMDVV